MLTDGSLLLLWVKYSSYTLTRASDFFQDWWAEVTHGAKNNGSFSEMMGPSLTADNTVKPVLSGH